MHVLTISLSRGTLSRMSAGTHPTPPATPPTPTVRSRYRSAPRLGTERPATPPATPQADAPDTALSDPHASTSSTAVVGTVPAFVAALPPPPDVLIAWDGDHRLTDIPGAAALTGVSIRTVYNWITSRRVTWRYLPSGKLRIYVESLWHAEQPKGRMPTSPANIDPARKRAWKLARKQARLAGATVAASPTPEPSA